MLAAVEQRFALRQRKRRADAQALGQIRIGDEGTAKTDQLERHALLGFTQPETLNDWPLREVAGDVLRIRPTIASSSGETLRHMALAGLGIVCLSEFMTQEDRRTGNLVQLLPKHTLDMRQSINAVHYRNTALAARITCFVDHMSKRPFDA